MQKNRALAKATKDWVLELDSDETIDPALKKRIQQVLSQPADASKVDVYKVKVVAYFLNKKIRFSGWTKYKLKFFRRTAGHYDDSIVHETLLHQAPKLGKIPYPIYNHTCDTLEQLLAKNSRYILSGATKRYAKGRRSSVLHALIKAILRAFKSYILRLGVLDGREGLIIAVGNFYQTFYTNLQLYYLEKEAQAKIKPES